MRLSIEKHVFPLKAAFGISRGSKTQADVLTVTLEEGNFRGRGECVPYARYGETIESVTAQIHSIEALIHEGPSREELLSFLSSGAARNAVDCAMWDLEAKKACRRAWDLAGVAIKNPLITAYTIPLDDPEVMQSAALENAHRPLLKLKLAGPDDIQRLKMVRQAAPKSEIMVDANEGWTLDEFRGLLPMLEDLDVCAVEQPLPVDQDEALTELSTNIPIIADESCHDCESYERIKPYYDFINIKLDKTGGLTEALNLRARAIADGKKVMIGCMVGSSLAMAPAMLVTEGATIVDLDGPLLLAEDRDNPIQFHGSILSPPDAELWG